MDKATIFGLILLVLIIVVLMVVLWYRNATYGAVSMYVPDPVLIKPEYLPEMLKDVEVPEVQQPPSSMRNFPYGRAVSYRGKKYIWSAMTNQWVAT